jgi:hypothetical protein
MSKELKEKYEKLIGSPLEVLTVDHVNFKPHPFTIGSRHVTHAADHCGGRIGDETIKAVPCAHPGCRLAYEDHTSDHVIFVKLIKNCKQDEVRECLKAVIEESKKDKIDGFAFVKSEFEMEK